MSKSGPCPIWVSFGVDLSLSHANRFLVLISTWQLQMLWRSHVPQNVEPPYFSLFLPTVSMDIYWEIGLQEHYSSSPKLNLLSKTCEMSHRMYKFSLCTNHWRILNSTCIHVQTVILLVLLCCVLKVLIHKSFLWNEWTTSFIDWVQTDCPGYIIAKEHIDRVLRKRNECWSVPGKKRSILKNKPNKTQIQAYWHFINNHLTSPLINFCQKF